jgi:hypothetical protein
LSLKDVVIVCESCARVDNHFDEVLCGHSNRGEDVDQSGGWTPWTDLEIPDADFDIAALHSAIDERRRERQLSWIAVAREIAMRTQQRTAFPQVMRLARWLRSPAASLTRIAQW